MNKQIKKTVRINKSTVIAIISILFNIFLIIECISLLNHERVDKNLIMDNNIESIEKTNDFEQKDDIKPEEDENENKELEKEYIYKYIEGKEKQVLVEKEVEKTIEVPTSSTDATVTYIDVSGNSKSIKIPSGTIIDFSAGEHGTYDTVPASITLTDNQELDITDSSYNPSKVEVNYIFKGFSYSGDTMTCMYSLADNIINTECKKIASSVIKNDIIYIKHEYIESTGTQYINTKYIPTFNTEVEITYAYTEQSMNYSPLFYSGNTYDSADSFGVAYGKTAKKVSLILEM